MRSHFNRSRYCKHDYSNDWFCPYVDVENECFVPTCCKCGKVKYQRLEYVGRNKKGKRIIKELK